MRFLRYVRAQTYNIQTLHADRYTSHVFTGGGGNYLARAAVGTADYNVLLLFLTINDFWKNNYFEVYLTDIRQIIMVVDIR